MAKRPTPQPFEEPTDPDRPGSHAEDSEFEAPGDTASVLAEAADAEIESYIANVDSQILAAKAEIEKLLGYSAGSRASAMSDESIASNIVGVGIGLGDGNTAYGSGSPGDPVLELYTIEPEPAGNTLARMAAAVGISALASGDFPVNVVPTGIIEAYPHRFRDRPAPCGISAGTGRPPAGGSTGTLGALARGLQLPRSGRLLVLSNNHVFADTNAAPLGTPLIQPGFVDGGLNPGDQIAILERVVPISFAAGASNVVDCATGWAWPDRVRREQVRLVGGVRNYFRTGSVPVAAVLGLPVGKSGRTTQLTSGRVTAVGVTIVVNYGPAGNARFVGQIAIRAPGGLFSDRGDSGSLIWTWDARRAPVGLLFAGGGGTTFANPISRVLAALQIALVT